MQFNIENRSGENLVLLASDNFFDKESLIAYMNGLDQLLNDINKDNWVESVDPAKINALLANIKEALSPMLAYIGVLLDEEVRTLDNVWQLPKFLYAISIVPAKLRSLDVRANVAALKDGVTLNFNTLDIGAKMTNIANNRLVIDNNTGYVDRFTQVLKDAISSSYSSPDLSEPSDNVIHTLLDSNLHDYIINTGQFENYSYGYSDGYNSVPLATIILFFTVVIIIIVVVAIIVIWLVNIFKKNNVNVHVTGSKIEPEALPEIVI
jgi:hypothetical protein